MLKINWKWTLIAATLLLGLSACGSPADVNSAANQAATAVAGAAGSDAVATAQAAASDPTVQALANEAITAVSNAASDPGVQSAVDQAFSGMNDRVTLAQGQALALSSLSAVPDITNYKMTVVDTPAGAEASKGQVIKEASNGNVSISPDEYSKYFTKSGDYKVRLDLTTSGNKTASHEFTVTVP